MQRINQTSSEVMKRLPIPIAPSPSSPSTHPDLLWISKQQQQHPLTHLHPLKNTIRVNSTGKRHKFDGKQWRSLCESSDGYECRNLSFRSSLCQKHFYKLHLVKRPYTKTGSTLTSISGIQPLALKRPASNSYELHDTENTHKRMHEDDDDDSIEVIDNDDLKSIKRDCNKDSKDESQPEYTFFSIDCDQQSQPDTHELHHMKVQPLPKNKQLDSTNNHCIISNESENPSLNVSISKLTESTRLGIPPLTRTEEKSLANELIIQLPADASFSLAEQIARRRACEIVMDNYSHRLLPTNVASEWFYDFLLRNPRLPIHFQSWFSSIKPTIPSSDQIIDIKIWQLGLVTRSIIPSSSISTSSSSP